MGRRPCCSKEGLNRGAWTALEDKILTSYIKAHGEGKWRNLPKRAGLKRCGKSCRLRWLNYLRPDIKRGNISHDEEELIIRLHNLLGNRWSLIAGRLPGRTDNEIKNYWNTNLGKKAKAQTQTQSSSPGNSGLKKISSELQTTETSNSQPTLETKAIRTKATRCTKLLYPLLQPSEEVESNHTLTPQDQPELQDEWNQNEVLDVISRQKADFLTFGSNDHVQTSITGEEQYSLQPFEIEEMFVDWTKNPCLEEDNNATLDLDLFEFFLNNEDWPSQEIPCFTGNEN
ncbi:hypothetical protein SLA2020_007440 [Shorea laevis]